MFHWNNNVFFGRMENGGVRILAFSATPDSWPVADGIYDPTDPRFPVIFDQRIDANSWLSLISSVSAGGEVDGRFYSAERWHNSTGPVEITGKHIYWAAGEPDCPKEIKAGNGELHTLRCKVCGVDSPRGFCRRS